MAQVRRRRVSLSRTMRRMALYRGLLGGSRGWMAVGAVFVAGRAVKQVFARTPETLALDILEPGQSLQVVTMPRPTRRQLRKAARRT